MGLDPILAINAWMLVVYISIFCFVTSVVIQIITYKKFDKLYFQNRCFLISMLYLLFVYFIFTLSFGISKSKLDTGYTYNDNWIMFNHILANFKYNLVTLIIDPVVILLIGLSLGVKIILPKKS
jgi:hypothetical protein